MSMEIRVPIELFFKQEPQKDSKPCESCKQTIYSGFWRAYVRIYNKTARTPMFVCDSCYIVASGGAG